MPVTTFIITTIQWKDLRNEECSIRHIPYLVYFNGNKWSGADFYLILCTSLTAMLSGKNKNGKREV